jgi:tRNA-specific 2-thiouridylase
VRKIARALGFSNVHQKESQDICFIPDGDYKKFIKDRAEKEVCVPGPLKDHTGCILGEHRGIGFYTIGQRDGLGVAVGHPLYVYKIEKETNTIFVGPKELAFSQGLAARRIHFLTSHFPKKAIEVKVKIRYNQPEVRARLVPRHDGQVEIWFQRPQLYVAPGQSVVFYRRDRILGGGIIEKSF